MRNNGIKVTGLCELARALDLSGSGSGGASVPHKGGQGNGALGSPLLAEGSPLLGRNTTRSRRRLQELFLWGNDFEDTSAELFMTRIVNEDGTSGDAASESTHSGSHKSAGHSLHSGHSFSQWATHPVAPVLTDFIVYVVDGVHRVAQRASVK